MKKQSTLKRALALGMSATMVSATLAGCGGSASSTAATSTETASSATTEAEATTDSDKPFAGTTLTWYTTLNGNVSDNFANLVWSAAYDNWGSFYVDDGVVKNGLIEDSRKDFIQKMADWYAEGLLDNDWMQADKKSTQTDFVSGNCILGYAPFGQGLGNYTKAMMEADPNFKEDYIQAAAPVTSTKGKNAKFSKMNNIYDQSGASAAISSQCKNVKAAVWLLDWLYSEEGQICYNFGIEGESYEMKDGKPVYTDLIMNNPDGMSVAQALAAYTRASTSGTGIQSEDYIDQYYAQDNQKKALELSMKTDMGEHMFPPTSVSEENQDRYSEIMSQVKTLADEMEASFICGTTPMSEWDSYQQKLKDAGIEEAVQMMQEAYDTYMAN